MNKSLAYYIETFSGRLLGLLGGLVAFFYCGYFKFIGADAFYDKLITVSTTLFGFLLTVLTLIVQSNSPTVTYLKQSKGYSRLIKFNRRIVVVSAIICLLSLLLNLLCKDGKCLDSLYTKIPATISFGLFVWVMVDTFFFVHIFYKILLSESRAR